MKLMNPNGTSLTLSDDLLWTDEFDWRQIAQSETIRTLSGSYFVQQGIKKKGRSITLQSPDGMAWHTRSVVETLQNWSAQPQAQFTLMRGKTETAVIFVSVSASPVLGFGGDKANDYFMLTIQFLTA